MTTQRSRVPAFTPAALALLALVSVPASGQAGPTEGPTEGFDPSEHELGDPEALEVTAIGDPAPQPVRPETWDMTVDELQEIGLGQTRADPVPPPPGTELRNLHQPPVGGGVQPPPQIIFVNFGPETMIEGSDDAKINQSRLFGGEFAAFGDDPTSRAAVMQAVRLDWGLFNIDVVDTRPAAGEYTMNMTGPTNFVGAGVLGIAPLDCGNFETHSNVTYAFHAAGDDPSTVATTIGQEVAHSYGLEHVDEPADILNPFNAGGDPSFIDECLPLSSGPGGACPDQHMLHCPDGSGQNSFAELITLFGPAFPDVEGPIILVQTPLTNTVMEEGATFQVIVTIMDESLVDEATLYSNGMPVMIDTSEPWGWQISNVPAGLYTLEVLAYDEHGNEGLSTPISILVGGPGAAGADETGGDSGPGPGPDPSDTNGEFTTGLGGIGLSFGVDIDSDSSGPGNDGSGCGCTQGEPRRDLPWAALLLVPLIATVRRRRRA